MSAPYTHTVTLTYDAYKATGQIAEIVDGRWALIFVPATSKPIFADVSQSAWDAAIITGMSYRVALHDMDTLAVIISRIA